MAASWGQPAEPFRCLDILWLPNTSDGLRPLPFYAGHESRAIRGLVPLAVYSRALQSCLSAVHFWPVRAVGTEQAQTVALSKSASYLESSLGCPRALFALSKHI